MSLQILCGDWIEQLRTLPDQSVHCVVTSPPYWGLRKYIADDAPEKRFELGLEKTPEEYLSKLVAGFEEVRRVLRDDGTLWLNMGDCYSTHPYADSHTFDPKYGGRNRSAGYPNRQPQKGLKHKDLLGLPWMVAFALRAAGWYLRCDIIWHKPNPMPESVTDRPTRAHEYIFLLTKKPRYFYDAEAVKEPVTGGSHPCANGPNSRMVLERAAGREDSKPNPSCRHIAVAGSGIKYNDSFDAAVTQLVSLRNQRSVWTVASAPFKGAHFATFPPRLIPPCILAGTSAKGCCPKCGAPWERIVEKPQVPHSDYAGKFADQDNRGRNLQRALKTARANGGGHDNPFPGTRTVGWVPGCKCDAGDPVPAVVLDPFAGTLTSCQVALELGRSAIGIELSPEYVALGRQRCAVTPGLAIA